ncbi:glycosyltransferase family 4 protein [Flavobacterium sp. CSZ]|uniref:glycosyltransferase family 4 protein n=1 Tax=Flavobacterium sp. CSZ TaxID=2783791 RepID=UPI001E359AEE|nr:glycosyltransferase family 4 protein [Flavobacterium sp. CSZ]
MDYFFWEFDKKCKESGFEVDWFFPNQSNHGEYSNLNIYECKTENNFLSFCEIRIEYSHIITHFVELCTPFFYKIKKLTDAKVIAVDHNPRPLHGYPVKKRINKRLKGILFSRYIDVFVGVSEFTKKELVKDFGSHISYKIEVISNGLDFAKYTKKQSFSTSNKFIVVSHLRKEKGIQDLILAVNEMEERNSLDFSFDIYGKGYYKKELQEMIEKFSLQKFFNFKGSVSNLNQIYSHYDFLVHPSRGETFCYVVLESLICNLPVITTLKEGNVLGLIKENENGFLFQATKTDQLKTILENILNQKYILDNNSDINDNLHAFSLSQMVDNYFKLII